MDHSAPTAIAVLTGDLIASTDLAPARLDLAFDRLDDAAGGIAAWQSPPCPGRLTRNRGDGWQMVVGQPALALRAALCLRAALRAEGDDLATRIAIAVGPGILPQGGDLNQASGIAFTESGRALDALKAPATLTHAAGGALGAATRLADHISARWTPAQARAMRFLLWPGARTRSMAATDIGITRQAVDQALAAAGFAAIRDALALIEGKQNAIAGE